jgi:hypothetical protein
MRCRSSACPSILHLRLAVLRPERRARSTALSKALLRSCFQDNQSSGIVAVCNDSATGLNRFRLATGQAVWPVPRSASVAGKIPADARSSPRAFRPTWVDERRSLGRPLKIDWRRQQWNHATAVNARWSSGPRRPAALRTCGDPDEAHRGNARIADLDQCIDQRVLADPAGSSASA